MGHRHHRSVGAVGRAEGVVDVGVGQRGELFGETRIVFFLSRVEPEVLQHGDGPGARRHHGLVHIGPDHLVELADHRVELLAQQGCDGIQPK